MSAARTLGPAVRVRSFLCTPITPAPSASASRYFAIARPAISNPGTFQRLSGQAARRSWKHDRSLPSRSFRFVRFKSSKPSTPSPNPTPQLGSPEPSLSLSQRMRKLSREYGWTVVGVYGLLTVLDFPFCYMAVKLLGTERIGRYEHAAIEAFWSLVHIPFPDVHKKQAISEEGSLEATAREGEEVAEAAVSKTEATIWTTLALAYAVHKSLIFIRVPLTAAVTPKVVKTLRGWGWNIGKRKPKP